MRTKRGQVNGWARRISGSPAKLVPREDRIAVLDPAGSQPHAISTASTTQKNQEQHGNKGIRSHRIFVELQHQLRVAPRERAPMLSASTPQRAPHAVTKPPTSEHAGPGAEVESPRG
jgi:hypothetical protein